MEASIRSPPRFALSTATLLVAFATTGELHGQTQSNVDFTQLTRPVVQVTDSAIVDYLLFELFVEPLDPPTRLQLIDVTQNGFGPDDVMIVFPSGEVFTIPEFLPDSVQSIMSSWQPEVEYRMDSGNMSSSALASLIGSEPDDARRAEGAILYDLVQAVERSYHELPVSLLFQRDSIGFTFQLWDYRRPGMSYTPRPEFVPDTAVSAVLDMLRVIGYVPGQNATRTGLSLEEQGQGVVTVDRALQGMTRLPNEQMRILAAQTVLLGSYDFDRSGAIDRASEIDAPPCAVWGALDDAFPNFLALYGFDEGGEPYVGDVVFHIAPNVREPADRRGAACLRGDPPPETDPESIEEPASGSDLPEAVERFVRLEAAGDILQNAGRLGTTADDWAEEVRVVLGARFDRDRSGLLDQPVELRAIPCDVWQAMAATHPDYPYGMGFLAGEVYVGDHLGVAPSQREEVLARASGCIQTATRTASVDAGPGIPEGLQEFLELLTAAGMARAASDVPAGSLRWATLIQSTLMAHYDLDGSGLLDQTDEIIEVPCSVWKTIEATSGGPLSELGFGGDGEFLGDQIGIQADQRLLATARIEACEADVPPAR